MKIENSYLPVSYFRSIADLISEVHTQVRKIKIRGFVFHIAAMLLLVILVSVCDAQTVSGRLSGHAGQNIRLEGFNGLKTYTISTTQADGNGNFKLSYSENDYGVAYLMSSDNKPLFILLPGEDVEIAGEALATRESVKTIKGAENKYFERYSREQPRREQALSAWTYLEKMYGTDTLFSRHKNPSKAVQEEKKRLQKEDQNFLETLPAGSYVKWFLPIRKLVSSVAIVAQYRTEEISATIGAFRNLDYTDKRLYKSGLFKDAIESQFWLLENCGKPLDSVNVEMRISIDAMMSNLVKDEKRLNEVTDFLFDLLEKHSLFQASEYLALKVLNEVKCTVNQDLAKQLETYRAMKKGNTAPDIIFPADFRAPAYSGSTLPSKLSELSSRFTVVVFGASWCPKCSEELPAIATKYAKWKQHGLEVVFVSLDDSKESYQNFVRDFPFISVCDFRKWDSNIVKEYYVFGTPTMYLLDGKREIILRPNSVNQMDSWVDWFLVKGNLK